MAGSTPLDAELAAILEQEFDLEASFWLDIEADYRRRLAEKAAADDASGFAKWARLSLSAS